MGNFFKGFLCGIGIGFVVAPMRGQETRRFLGERVQTLRQSLPATEQIQSYGQKISDQAAQATSAFKDASVQVKEKTGESANMTQSAPSTGEPARINSAEATELASTQLQKSVRIPPSSPVTPPSSPVTPPSSPVAPPPATNFAGKTSASNNSLSTLPGIEPEVQRGLEQQGISTISQLLEQTRTKERRADLAQKTSIPTHQLKTLIDRADLMRLTGIGGDRATLLEEAGVTGCKDLQHRNPEHLHATLTDWQKSGMAASPIPTLDQVTQWIAEAKIVAGTAQGK